MREVRLTTGKDRDRIERVWLVADDGAVSPQLRDEYDGTVIAVSKPRGRGGRVISLWNQLSNEYLYMSDEHLIVESALDLRRIGRLY